MTTATSPKIHSVDIIWNEKEIKLATGGQVCVLNHAAYDFVALDDEEDDAYASAKKAGQGRSWFNTGMTTATLRLWMSIRDKWAKYVPGQTPAPEPTTLDVKPVDVPPAPELKTLEHHTATVEMPEGEEYKGGNKVRKPRKRKDDPEIRALYEDVTNYCRAWDMDTLISRIRSLKTAKAFLSGKVKRITYDIPKMIRDEINEPARIFRCIGFMPTESEVIAREEALERNIYIAYRNILGRYMKGTDNAKRLGCFVKFRVTDISYENVSELNEEVSENLDEAVRAAHTRLITSLDSADKALAEAQGDEKLTLNDIDEAQRDRDNLYRAALRKAHEELNTVLRCAEGFDHDENVDTLIEGLHALTRTRAATFNAECRKRDAKGVEI